MLSTSDGGPGPVPPSNLWSDWLLPCVQKDPNATALVSVHQAPSHLSSLVSSVASSDHEHNAEHLQWTYGQLGEASHRVALFLASRDVGTGDVIATFIWNSVEWVIFCWAVLRLGATLAPVDPRALDRPDELKHLLESIAPRAFLAMDAQAAVKLEKHAGEMVDRAVRIICSLEPNNVDGEMSRWINLEALPLPPSTSKHDLEAKLERSQAASTPDTVALVLFTSGTTNAPKGCPLTVANFSGSADAYTRQAPARFLSHSPGKIRFLTTTLNFRPIFFLGCFATWRSSGTVVISGAGAFDAGNILSHLAEEECTHVFLVPTQFMAMLRHPHLAEYRQRFKLEFVNLTGDVTTQELLRLCKDQLRAGEVLSVWGMTEGVGILGWEREGDAVKFREDGLTGVGRVMAGAKVKICELDGRTPVERGTLGDLHVCGDVMIKGYLGGRSADSFYADEQGRWMIVGDHAIMDEDGVIYVLGRGKDTIIREGVNISPGVIEGCLNKDEDLDVQVVGIPHAEQGAVPVAIVKGRSENATISKEVLQAKVKKELGYEHSLDAIYSLADLGFEQWPVNATGKVMKRDLREAILQVR